MGRTAPPAAVHFPCSGPGLGWHAEGGIHAFWRVEPGRATPLLRTYILSGERYRPEHSVEGAEPVKLDAPYPIRIAPAAWL